MEILMAHAQALLGAIDVRLQALEARPTDPEIAARVAALEAELAEIKASMVQLETFDQTIRDIG